MGFATLLENMKTALSTIDGIETCKIGLEADLVPTDYPMIRIVPSKITPSRTLGRRRAEVLVYFGADLQEFEGGLEATYAALSEMEEAIITAAGQSPAFGAVHLDTTMDEDRIEAYKLMALRFDVEG